MEIDDDRKEVVDNIRKHIYDLAILLTTADKKFGIKVDFQIRPDAKKRYSVTQLEIAQKL